MARCIKHQQIYNEHAKGYCVYCGVPKSETDEIFKYSKEKVMQGINSVDENDTILSQEEVDTLLGAVGEGVDKELTKHQLGECGCDDGIMCQEEVDRILDPWITKNVD